MDQEMHSRPYSINTANELRLRRHIREILLPYARTHLTTNHVIFTERAVENLLLHSVDYVPMADATSFLLPTEPFDVLIKSLDALDLKPHDERWTAPSETVRSLKGHLFPPPPACELQSERCWHEGDDTYERLSGLCRPMSPVLTNRARRETPKLGSTKARASVPRTESALTALLGLKPVSVDSAKDLPAPATDDVLDLRFKLDSSTRAEVRPFVQSVLAPPTRGKSRGLFGDTPSVDAFLRCDSPPRCPLHLDSPPLFSRIARPGHAGVTNHIRSGIKDEINVEYVSAIAPMLKHAPPEFIESEDGDINGHHMEVVNGWTTLTLSSPPPSSLHGSSLSEVDELWDVSPPATPATSLIAAKMEEVEIPRIHTFGRKTKLDRESTVVGGIAGLLTFTKSPGSFIASFISAPIPMTRTPKPTTSQLEVVKPSTQSPRLLSSPNQSTSNSLLGQPPSACKEQVTARAEPPFCVEDYGAEELCLDAAVAGIYASTPHDPLSCILEERLDDKEIMLMGVPNLPPPTAHPKDPTFFPEGIQSFVAPKERTLGLGEMVSKRRGAGPPAFLRPVKGIKPLSLDLSWRPFDFGKTIPTDEDVADVGKPLQMEGERQVNDAREPLDLATPPMSSEDVQNDMISTNLRKCGEFGTSPTPGRDEQNTQFEYVLTRRERMKASGVEITLEEDAEARQDIELNLQDQEIESALGKSENLDQRDNSLVPRNLIDALDHAAHRTSRGTFFDDSGVDIVDQDRVEPSNGSLVLDEFGPPVFPKPRLRDNFLYEMDELEADKENVDGYNENKENIPPWNSANEEQLAIRLFNHFKAPHDLVCDLGAAVAINLEDRNEYLEYPESAMSTFERPSFMSQSQALGSFNDPQYFIGTRDILGGQSGRTDDINDARNDCSDFASTSRAESTRRAKRRRLDDIVPASSRDLLSTFVGLRNQAPLFPSMMQPENRVDAPMPQASAVPEKTPPQVTPDDMFDQRTVRLPEHWIPATTIHRYLASMAVIQKRALVHELQDDPCRVVLVERYDLGGADMIIDPDHGVLFVPLFTLPAQLETALDRISRESWCYSNLLIVFEAYPSAQGYRADASRNTGLVPYAYSPPLCKAVKKLRRTLAIAEGCGTMNPRCSITWAFANRVEECGRIVRCFGEEARTNAVGQGREILWDEREWLEEEEREGESDLSRVQGMNAFAAFIMLYDRPLQSILDASSEVRLEDFGQLLGQERLAGLNDVIEKRMQEVTGVGADFAVGSGY
ncbi:hypothetical protein BS17DRAFT_778498 [Gyrodon lividus]|nr:hypothetical protein BS17DRAFT_778498 [Gyrodon lividus]